MVRRIHSGILKWFFLLLICLPLRLPAGQVASPQITRQLPASVQQKLDRTGIPTSALGVYVQEVGASQPMLALNADTAMNPASAMKLVTTYAGLEILGPAYAWQTVISAHGKILNGILHGDLVIKGYGDPKLDLEHFWLLIHRLRQTGLTQITGNLILDHSYYDIPPSDPGAFDGQPYRTYNILPEALLVNYRSTALHLMPDLEKKGVRVTADPIPDSLRVVNNLKLSDKPCGGWRNFLDVEIEAGEKGNDSPQVILNGSFSARCGRQSLLLGLHDSAIYTRELFKRFWSQQGGVFDGDVIIAEAPADLSHLKTYYSPPLAEVIRGINKFSNNIAARQLFLTLGTAGSTSSARSPATLEKSEHALKQWLAAKQLFFPELVIENGSGLSRIERISARHMGQLLLTAFNSPVMPEFIASLPIAAVDGTMRGRLAGTAVSGLAHMKTGALNNVSALAGYMLDQSGRRVVVVVFVNHSQAARSREATDTLLQWIYER
ncbi:D-alanyl-D-alanine carboxypeptidase / D-alanyl-D-alanine-endopeptidase (penicillin-binding protein 4) [Nitrosomonas sp. Nm51]|uniref:D-alanyl-D-alanine carboxypeptidase/D-alanyl-D-alanine endopeptidase n=1 Tax=Nitrosomonas sp. Nm51 TaxID=133720 RepID=UPI0008D5960D|nr:D-alanyl-D-alanine carboxypeptidase/D-alanyl-D-alanine-endopeptidase [Nitrosomonas sp. Nm51]SEQ95828.1 D-alanyl-D-alanine carboxypeptidase / D-alanyl-D-alanine-endopeptidase (penicillin-binding protein 4) [Nitrosomonas sp. Nm51]